MKPSRVSVLPYSLFALSLALAGCTTAAPVEVTRFHLAGPIAPGSFTVESGTPAGAAGLAPDSLETQGYNGIVSQQLTRLGFTPAPSLAQSDLVATVTVDRGTRQDLNARQSGFSFGLGGFGGGGGFRHGGTAVGGGIGATVPVGGNRPHYIIGTRLMVQLKRRSEGTVIWEGRAQIEAKGSDPASQPNAAVAKLATAMFTGFPGESGRTITVK
jgi:hypothetical protein